MDSPKLDTLLDDLADLARRALPQAEFYPSVLRAVIEACHAEAAGLWSVIGEKYRLESESGLLAIGLDVQAELQGLHEDALDSVSSQAGSALRVVSDDKEPLLHQRTFGDLEYRFFPCQDQGRAFLVLEVVTGRQSNLQWDFHGRLLAAVAEIVNDYYTQQRLAWLEEQHAVQADLIPILARIYAQPTLAQTAYEIANEGRRFLACDRLSVFQVQHGRCEIGGVSGADRVHSGSRQMRALRDLAASVTATGRPLSYTHAGSALDQLLPQQQELMQRYLDVSAVSSLVLVPLLADSSARGATSDADALGGDTSKPIGQSNPTNCVGALAIEGVDTSIDGLARQRIEAFGPHAGRALVHAIALESTPLITLGRRVQRFDKSAVMRKAAVGLIIMLGVAALFWIPTDLTVQAKGRYQPSDIQTIYAPLNGEVIQFPESPRAVKAGETLIVMRSRQWELKKQELLTQRGVTLEKLRGVESARLNTRRPSSAEGASATDLSASEGELRELLASQEEQLSVLDQMLRGLTIESPVSGTMLSWNPLESWQQRPVEQGQKLLTIAKDGQAAQLQLQVRDSDIRHVWTARNQSENVRATFAIASNPGARFTAQLHEIGTITESIGSDGPCVRVTALVDSPESVPARHGATVVARIHCGRTSVAYAWSRRLIDYVTMHWLP